MTVLQTTARQAFALSLNQLLDRHGFPSSKRGRLLAFAELVKRPSSTAHRWLSGNGIPGVEKLLLLCDIFACSMDELVGRIPIKRENIDIDQTTTATYFSDNGNANITIPSSFLPLSDSTQHLGMVRVPGVEMSGYAEPNDRVFFNLADTDIRSGSVYVLRIWGRLVIRRLRIRLDLMIDVLCENQRYPAEQVAPDRFKPADIASNEDIGVLGRVIAKLNFDHNLAS